ncbi:hypothetical protein FQA39_LY00325 [Lamprigera yunnana]|nr:hypothetical protein FQA39_LY00325 [Lamprigera yunnana]
MAFAETPIVPDKEEQLPASSVNAVPTITTLPSFAPSSYHNGISPPPTGQNTNLYRRVTTKKAVYAQIPGLVSSQSSPPSNVVSHSPQPTLNIQSSPSPLSNYFSPTQNENVPQVASENRTTTLEPINIPLTESNTNVFDIFTPPLPSVKNSQLSALLTPSSSSPLLADSGISHYYDGLNAESNLSTSFSYGNDNSSSTRTLAITNQMYRPVYHHWFHKRICEGRTLWEPFSMLDSLSLERAFTSANLSPDTVIPTNGGRYDVNILRRERYPVYWTDLPTQVRRCSWFSKGSTEGRFVPYEENIATMLEEEFKSAFETNTWHKVIKLPNVDTVIFHGPDTLVLLPSVPLVDPWGNSPQMQPKSRILKRGMDEFDIDEGESSKVDHLIFVVHGIGSACDLKFRSVQEVVDEFRAIALQLIQSHYRVSCDTSVTHRIEILPISWHGNLHSESTGVDEKLKNITLESIPRLREFTNSTLLDILFYTSPIYCQTIITAVTKDLNRTYKLFKERNPTFEGGISLVGHSLGSLILFDILCHENPNIDAKTELTETKHNIGTKEFPHKKPLKRRISRMFFDAGSGQPKLVYPQLTFQPTAFFALGSPIGMFITVRGLDKLGPDFALPTCNSFFNIFHPYDPVAYRIESLINPELAKLKSVLIPHHKGRKRMHLELKETMYRVSSDLKQKLVDSVKFTWNTIFQGPMFGQQSNSAATLEAEVDRVLEEELSREDNSDESASALEEEKTNVDVGILNRGRRIDYVLQEAPIEIFNEYLFAVTSHLCYWESEDTVLFIVKEIYSSMGIGSDGSRSTM